jgi:hypothetical protein
MLSAIEAYTLRNNIQFFTFYTLKQDLRSSNAQLALGTIQIQCFIPFLNINIP